MLNKLKKSPVIKTVFIAGIIVLLILLFLTIILSRPSTPPTTQPNDQTIPSETSSQSLNITYDGEDSITIKQANIYRIDETSENNIFPIVEVVEKIIDRYSLQPVYDEKTVAVYASEDHTLNISMIKQNLNFSRNNPSGEPTAIDQDQAVKAAQDFIKTFLPEQNLYPITENIEYFSGDYHLQPSTKISANVVLIPFSYNLDGIPLYYESDSTPFLTILVNSKLQIQKMNIETKQFASNKAGTANIIPLSETINNINQKQLGTIISYSETSQILANEPTLSTIKQGSLKTAQLEYRVDSNRNLIYPFYRFEGTLADANGIEFEGEIITPAINIEE